MVKTAKQMTLGSLFDGIGGFPLAGVYAGMKPVWASEIEPFPIRVTEKRLPGMKHYGDIHRLSGAGLEPVDVVTFGSPCQDLSIAGKRGGLEGARSGLFYQAVRIIQEMRDATNGQYPKWAVWENVPGALSSHNGEDFRQVLESLLRVKDPEANVPLPENHKWLPAGEIMGDGYSLAWRVLDAAQGWGVAQRRKRVFAVLDLAGQRAGQVLFESEGVSGYTPPRGEARQGAAAGAAGGVGAAGCAGLSTGGFCTGQSSASRSDGYGEERAPTLRGGKPPGVAIGFNPTDGRIHINRDGICQTLCSRMGTGGNQTPLTLKIRFGSCSMDGVLPGESVRPSLEDVRGTPLCSRSLIVQTLYERAKEFFRIYRDVIEKAGHLDKVHAVIITGGGANLRAIDEVARDVFGVPVRIGAPLCFDEKNALSMRPNASVAAGLLMAADKTRAAGDSRSYRTPSLLNLSGRIRTVFFGDY